MKCNTIWDKVSTDIKKKFNSEPIQNKENLKTKIKSYHDEGTEYTVGCNHNFLALAMPDSVYEKDENYYLQVFLKKCKFIEKEKKEVMDRFDSSDTQSL